MKPRSSQGEGAGMWQRGVTLVELLVGLTIGLILMSGVVQLFLASKQSYSVQQAVSRVQENGRLAMEFLSRDLRSVGYLGCLTGKTIVSGTNFKNLLNNPTQFANNFGDVIVGYDNVAAGFNSVAGISPVVGTDVLVVRGPDGTGMYVDPSHNSDGNVAVTLVSTTPSACSTGNGTSYNGLCEGDILMLSNCARVLVFQATNLQLTGSDVVNVVHGASGSPGNAVSSWNTASGVGTVSPGEEVLKLQTVVYYIGTSTRTGRSGLFRRVGGGNPSEIIEDVDSMSLVYGVDTGADHVPDVYRRANAVADWTKVSAVRVQLLLSTPDQNVLPTAQTGLTFNDSQAVTTTDRRLRQIFSSTIALRNRAAH